MARKRSSPMDDMIDVTAMLPWWVGGVAAVISYLFLHHYATQEAVIHAGTRETVQQVGVSLYRILATPMQYVIPLVFLSGSLVSFVKRKKRQRLLDQTADAPNASALNEPTWQEFEVLVGEAFRHKGYAVRETGGGGADGGVDLVISRDGKKYLVQCKQWKSRQVGVKPVRELAGLVAAHGAAGGVMVTSGTYTTEATAFAKQARISLIAGEQLHVLIKEAKAGTLSKFNRGETKRATVSESAANVNCPECASPMVRRVARRGANAGQSFWGCSRYPQCRGTRPSA